MRKLLTSHSWVIIIRILELNTYHYTRTYLGVFYQGDSGRKWGYGTVSARGTFCDAEVWDSTVHYVKYGTESN